MPDFIDLTLRIRKEKLGDLVCDLPSYCQPVQLGVAKEMEIPPPKLVQERREYKQRKRRWGRFNPIPEQLKRDIRMAIEQNVSRQAILLNHGISKSALYKILKEA